MAPRLLPPACPLPLPRGRVRGRALAREARRGGGATLRGAPPHGPLRQPALLPLSASGRVWRGRRDGVGARQGGGGRLHAAADREAVRPRLRLVRGAQLAHGAPLRRDAALSDRPLPRQGDPAQHFFAPVGKLALRASLVGGAHRGGAGHLQGGPRHAGARRLLRRRRHRPRRDPEPPAAGPALPDHGAARGHVRRRHPRRQGVAAQVGSHARPPPRRRLPRAVRALGGRREEGLPRRPDRRPALPLPHLRRLRALHRLGPVARRPLPPLGREGPRRAALRGARSLPAKAVQRPAWRRLRQRAGDARAARRGHLRRRRREDARPLRRRRARGAPHARGDGASVRDAVRRRLPLCRARRLRADAAQRRARRPGALGQRGGADRGVAHLHAAAAPDRRGTSAASGAPLWPDAARVRGVDRGARGRHRAAGDALVGQGGRGARRCQGLGDGGRQGRRRAAAGAPRPDGFGQLHVVSGPDTPTRVYPTSTACAYMLYRNRY
mmetsp:Transcript_12200/g.38525  ORF Transcript_12200/g.38525 Transcript_12200/m.38525 type:complete len:497 (+) Transcript_12200:485-1975(+)